MVDLVFSANNLHHRDVGLFRDNDPQLSRLASAPCVFKSELIDQIPSGTPGIYTVGGGRQVGKTTLLKQWMVKLLDSGIPPTRIWYVTGELINDQHHLVRLASQFAEGMDKSSLFYLIVDEVTYIRDWDKGIKYLSDSGIFNNAVVVLTGSDLSFIKEARKRFPGRHGKAGRTEFMLYPLSFRQALLVKNIFSGARLDEIGSSQDISGEDMEKLYGEFDKYLLHGGYMTAINDMQGRGRILAATFATYSDWIRGDVMKRGKRENYLRELLSALITQYGSQTTWHSIASDTSIDHHATVSDYVGLLCGMEAVFINSAIVEHKLCEAPKKARKIFFSDPFILHSIKAWLEGVGDPFDGISKQLSQDSEFAGKLVEGVTVSQCRRKHRCFYIKAEREVDIAYLEGKTMHPVEIKWTNQIRHSDIKQVLKYRNGIILTKQRAFNQVEDTPLVPLPWWLLKY